MRVVLVEKDINNCSECPHCYVDFFYGNVCCHPNTVMEFFKKLKCSEHDIPDGCPFRKENRKD